MSHSECSGISSVWKFTATKWFKFMSPMDDSFWCVSIFILPRIGGPSEALGVGHNPQSISPVKCPQGASWNNKRLAGVVRTFQVRKHLVEAQIDESSNIFANNPTGSDFLYKPEIFRPEVTVIFLAFSLPGLTKWLAWSREPTANKVNCLGGFT